MAVKLSPKQQARTREMEAAVERMLLHLENGDGEDVLNRYLRAMGAFHKYSFHNVALIITQYPEAHRVAGFNTWKNQFERAVRKGERAIWIWAPITVKREVEDEETGEVVEVRRSIGFKPVPVFDVAQTDGEPLPEYREDLPDGDAILKRCERFAVDEGLEFRVEGIYDAAGQAALSGRITVDPNQSPGRQAQTAIHELAHQVLHMEAERERREAVTRGKTENLPEMPSREVRELEAEAVTCAVLGALGYDVSLGTAVYLRAWSADRDGVKRSLDRIRRTAGRILDGFDAVMA